PRHTPDRPSLPTRRPSDLRYVLCVLKPSGEFTIDARNLVEAADVLTNGRAAVPVGDYAAMAGLSGDPPVLLDGSANPFRRHFDLDRKSTRQNSSHLGISYA